MAKVLIIENDLEKREKLREAFISIGFEVNAPELFFDCFNALIYETHTYGIVAVGNPFQFESNSTATGLFELFRQVDVNKFYVMTTTGRSTEWNILNSLRAHLMHNVNLELDYSDLKELKRQVSDMTISLMNLERE